MLSIKSLIGLLGKNILIHPFVKKRLKGVGYNLSVGRFGWSLKKKEKLSCTEDNLHFIVEPGDTALIMTNETLWLSRKIAGTLHTKVDRVSEGFSSISTTLDPDWIGPLLIAMTNLTENDIKLRKDDTITTVIFYKISKAGRPETKNPAGRTDRLMALGIAVEQDVEEWLNEELRNNRITLKNEFVKQSSFKELKNENKYNNFIKEYLVPFSPALLVFPFLMFAFKNMSPGQQIGPFLAAFVTALAIALNQILKRN